VTCERMCPTHTNDFQCGHVDLHHNTKLEHGALTELSVRPGPPHFQHFRSSTKLYSVIFSTKSRESAVGRAMDDRGVGVRVPVKSRIFSFSTSLRPALGPTQPPIQWVPGSLYPRVMRPEREADHSSPTSAEIKKRRSIHPLPHTPSWRSA
jgi:hypothetical protein